MKRIFTALLAALMLGLFAPLALAQTEIAVYISRDALPEEAGLQLLQLLSRALPEASFTLEAGGRTLGELVLADKAPQLAICPAREAEAWAREGLLLELDACVPEDARVAKAVLYACSGEDGLYMAPLMARHRRVAVNRRMLEEAQLGRLLDFVEYPVWLPMQLYQVLEEALLDGGVAMDVWPAIPPESGAVLALIQAMYNGAFLSEDGKTCLADSGAAVAGVAWLEEMIDCEMIGVAKSRKEALARFMAGETALFIDWTDEEAKALAAQGKSAMEVVTMPYPSFSGIPVHAFEVIGAAAFESGDEEKDALARAAAAFLMGDVQARRVLGERGIEEDGAIWLPGIGTGDGGAALHGMLCEVISRVIAGEMRAEAAMQAVHDAFGGRADAAK